MSTLSVNINGTLGTVIQCSVCQHTNPPQCPQCKPLGTETCIGCAYRGGGVPAPVEPPPATPPIFPGMP